MDPVELFLKELVTKYKHTTPTGVPGLPYYHGPGGLFGVAGLERDVISTRLHPRGLASILPGRGDVKALPYFPYLTGFTDNTGSVADGVCDDPETAGHGKTCIQTAQFGRYSYMTRELELNRVGLQLNRGEFQDLTLVNPPMLEDVGGMTTPNVPGNPAFVREVLMRFMELGISFQNKLIPQVYIGNPANNSVGGGYAEFPGLDILIGTNKVDAFTGSSCPSLNSDIKDFNYTNVTADGGSAMIRMLSYMMRYLGRIASGTNMTPVRWVLAMRDSLFYEITSVWPCSYMAYRCATNPTALVDPIGQYNVADAVNLRDDMRANKYLIIDGVRYEVVIDDGIHEDTNTTNANVPNPCFASDIYVIPMSVRGNIAATYWEYLDYSQGAMVGAQDGNLADKFFWSDGGRYLWHSKPPKNWCVQWLAKIEPRIILRTPHLAGRITNVVYCPLQHERDVFPDDPYLVDGGQSTPREYSIPYSDWNLRPA